MNRSMYIFHRNTPYNSEAMFTVADLRESLGFTAEDIDALRKDVPPIVLPSGERWMESMVKGWLMRLAKGTA